MIPPGKCDHYGNEHPPPGWKSLFSNQYPLANYTDDDNKKHIIIIIVLRQNPKIVVFIILFVINKIPSIIQNPSIMSCNYENNKRKNIQIDFNAIHKDKAELNKF